MQPLNVPTKIVTEKDGEYRFAVWLRRSLCLP
jgi:hypothetical protein